MKDIIFTLQKIVDLQIIHHDVADLEVSVDDVVKLKVVVIITERIDEALGNFQPAKVEDELNDGEEWEVEIFPVVVTTQNEGSSRSFLHRKQGAIVVKIPGWVEELPAVI